jgi:signal transduction histidine kinase
MDIAGEIRRFVKFPARYPLTATLLAGIVLLLFVTAIPLWLLVSASLDRDRVVRQELLKRDLREIVGRFDSEERIVLWKNLDSFLDERRAVAPLILPRHYYTALPARSGTSVPRLPPKNCFVDLSRSEDLKRNLEIEGADRICAYFARDSSYGAYLFLVISFLDNDLVAHEIGDFGLSGDALKIKVSTPTAAKNWTLMFQTPRGRTAYTSRYEVAAYMNLESGGRELDRRLEGWAHTQAQEASGAQVVTVIARLDIKAIDPAIGSGSDWPPPDYSQFRIALSRKNVSKDARNTTFRDYATDGVSSISIPSLYRSVVTTRAPLVVKKQHDGQLLKAWTFTASGRTDGQVQDRGRAPFQFVDGAWVFPSRNNTKIESAMPDTDLTFEIVHPGVVIEASTWAASLWLLFVLIAFTLSAVAFIWKVMTPIRLLAKHSSLIAVNKGMVAHLPYEDRKDEIGSMAKALNALLVHIREQTRREQLEAAQRAEDQRRKAADDLRAREASLRTIGHEIRAPLQGLLSLHKHGDAGHRYAARMLRAVEFLYGVAGPEAAFAGMQLELQVIDIAEFLRTVAANSRNAGIDNVMYHGPNSGIFCNVDDGAIEDLMRHILDNANRLRKPASVIDIRLGQGNGNVFLAVENEGKNIPEDLIERIFEFDFSLDPHPADGGRGQGLFVVRNYARKMGGEVKARNRATGVAFEVTLPLHEARIDSFMQIKTS